MATTIDNHHAEPSRRPPSSDRQASGVPAMIVKPDITAAPASMITTIAVGVGDGVHADQVALELE